MDLSSWFSGDVAALQKTGGTGLYTTLGFVGAAALGLALICFVAAGFVNWNAKVETERKRLDELQGEGLTNLLWVASPKALADMDFEDPISIGDLKIFQREVPPKPATDTDSAYPVANIVVQRNRRTIALADMVRVHDTASWELGSSERLLDGQAVVQLHTAFEAERFRNACEPLQVKGVAIIFVGLESYPTSDRQKEKDLSEERATALGRACLQYTVPRMTYMQDTTFWAVGLGRAQTEAAVNSALEIRQRAAVILTVSRRQARDEAISLPELFGALVQTARVNGTTLANYSESHNAAQRLRMNGTDFAGFLPASTTPRPLSRSVH